MRAAAWVVGAGVLGLLGCLPAEREQVGEPPPAAAPPEVEVPDAGGTLPETPQPPVVPPVPVAPPPASVEVTCSGPELPASTWLRLQPRFVSALAVAPDGDVLYGTQTQTLYEGYPENAALLGRLGPEGSPRWERSDFPLALFTSFDELSVAPRGAIYAWGGRSMSGPSGPVVLRFDADGLNSELIGGGNDETSLHRYQEDARGNLLRSKVTSGHEHLSVLKVDGTHWGIDPLVGTATLTAGGQLLVGASVQGRQTFRGQTLGQEGRTSFVVLRLPERGAPVWSLEVPGGAGAEVEETAPGGPLVGLGYRGQGPLAWPGTLPGGPLADSGLLVFTLGADGAPGWMRALRMDDVAGSPKGDVAILTSEPGAQGGFRVRLRVFSQRGAEVSDRTLATSPDAYGVSASQVAYGKDGALLVSGGFRGRVEIVGRPCSASDTGSAGFVLRVPGR